MKQRIKLKLTGLAFSVMALGIGHTAHAAPLGIADEPLFLVTNVPPNLMLVLDDSGSMSRAYAPDGLSSSGVRYRSNTYNPLYYDPAVTYTPPVDENNQPLSTSFGEAWINGFDPSRGDVDLEDEYRATYYYYPNNSNGGDWWAGQGFADASPDNNADYYLFDASNTNCNGTVTDNDCYDRVVVSSTSGPGATDERQNFANWYSFYRTRNLATVSASSLAFAQLSGETRVAWESFNWRCDDFTGSSCQGWDGTNRDNRLRKFGAGHRGNFYDWLHRLPASGGTPARRALERAGEYYRTDSRPYEYDPGVTTNPQFACRQNYSIFMTDGIWNGSDPTGSANADHDSTARTLPDGTAFAADLLPFADDDNTTIADVAFYYWATDLSGLAASDTLSYMPVTTNETVVRGTSSNVLTPYWNPKNDPANWQHMVTFTVGVGLSNWLNQAGIEWQGGTFDSNASGDGWNALASGDVAWPDATAGSGNRVYDLWHAATNSRGEFFSVESPNDIVRAFQTIINRIEARQGSASNLSFNAGSVSSNTMFFQSLFESGDWSGHLLARPISDGKGAASGNPSDGNLTCTLEPRGEICPTAWNAACQLTGGDCPDPLVPGSNLATNVTAIAWDTPASAGDPVRAILTHDGSNGVPFRWSDLNATQQALLQDGGNTDKGQATLNFIRGERACEESSTTTCSYDIDDDGTADDDDKLFRDRANLLGDIVNSSPVYVGPPERDYPLTTNWTDNLYGAATLPENSAADNYGEFLVDNFTRQNVAYVGSNDGMVHGFRTGSFSLTGTPPAEVFNTGTNDGREVLAYVPSKAFASLPNLIDPGYQSAGLHKFFADGQLEAVDAYFDNEWHTVLTGAMGAGGQGVFALDITNPSTFSEGNADDIVLWEFTDADDADLGFTFGQSVLVRLHNNKYGVLVGNGYNNTVADGNVSTTGNAVLFILDVETGAVLAKLDTGVGAVQDPEGDGTLAGGKPNGIATITPIDMDGDVITDFAYAGDLYGNVWRFDLTSNLASGWKVSYGASACASDGTAQCTPLFKATDTSTPAKRQPITTKILADKHPKGLRYGVMVYFGTGKYFEDTDNVADLTTNHSFYGVRDSEFSGYNTLSGQTVGLTNTPGTQYGITRAALVEQQIRVEALNTTTGNRERVFTSNAANNVGWFVDWLKGNGSVSGGVITDATSYTREGEMVVADPVLVGDVVLVPTLIPNNDACSTGGSGWLNVLNGETGGKLSFAPFFTKLGGEPVQGLYFGDAPPGTPAYISKKLYVPLGDGSVADLDFRLGLEGRKLWMELQ